MEAFTGSILLVIALSDFVVQKYIKAKAKKTKEEKLWWAGMDESQQLEWLSRNV